MTIHIPVKGEIPAHLKRVVFLLLRLWQTSSSCNFSGIEVDRRDAPHLRKETNDNAIRIIGNHRNYEEAFQLEYARKSKRTFEHL